MILFIIANGSLLATSLKSSQTITSDKLFFYFEDLNLHPQKQLLSNSLSDNFPYNIIITFNNEKSELENNKVSILVSQDYVGRYLKNFNNLFTYLQKNSTNRPIISFIFTAADESSEKTIAGTKTYISSLDNKESTLLLHLDYDKNNSSPDFVITPGGRSENNKGVVCSSSVLSTIIKTCNKENISYRIKGTFFNLYRLGLINTSKTLSYLLQEGVPAISIDLTNSNVIQVFQFLQTFMSESENWDSSITDIHYSLIHLSHYTVFVSEYMYVILMIISIAIMLFLSFGLSFVNGAHSYIHRKEFAKAWPIIPLAVIITLIFLILSQNLTNLIISDTTVNILFIFFLKIIFTILFVLLFSLAQQIFNFPMTGFIYGFLLTIVSLINIFIFASVDLPLAVVFIIEYIIIYITRKTRKLIYIVLIMFCMLVPYVPYLVSFFYYADSYSLNLIKNTSLKINFLFSWALVPFEIMMIRIAIRLQIWGRHPTATIKKTVIRAIITASAIILFIIGSVLFTLEVLPADLKKTENNNMTELSNILTLTTSYNQLVGRSFVDLQVSSRIPVLRYKIILESQNQIPILEANYPYDILGAPYIATFNLDAYPPEPLNLKFSYTANHTIKCKTIAYYDINDTVISKTKEIIINASENLGD
ncbi:MAG: hypothetical protein BKP49_01050 [Treponema sp. CETP13]|nr:MAG: hypothetical protein BKP49_01050 [Treponema sp. CETP13]